MGIKQLYNDNLRKLPNEYGDVSVMMLIMHVQHESLCFSVEICFGIIPSDRCDRKTTTTKKKKKKKKKD